MADDPNDLIAPTIIGLKDEQMLVIAVPIHSGKLKDIPPSVRAEPYIPFGQLLPFVDVMITNGGFGGTQMALAHGIPLVVAGDTEDKMEVSARVEWTGAGINLRRKHPSPSQVRQATLEVLHNPIYRQNARRLQEDINKCHAPTRVAELVETLALGK